MSRKVQLHYLLTICLLLCGTALLSAARPLGAAPDAFGLTVNVNPTGKGTVSVNPPPPYSNGQTVTLTATPIAGWTFDKWVLASDLVWWDNNWDYRVTVTTDAAGFARKNKPAEFALNFTQIWSGLGKTGTFDPNSVRVVEVDANDAVIDAAVPFQFDKAADYNAGSKAAGTLVLIMQGNTAAGATRRYHVYFDVTGKGFAPPAVPSQIDFTEASVDEGFNAYRLQTAVGTYYYHLRGGGFSSFNDVDGNDWISWSKAPGNDGDYRGIPNLVTPNNGGTFHPGRNVMVTTLVSKGPIKVTFMSVEEKQYAFREEWKGIWEIYPTYAKFTVLVAPYDYWFLYEGTPGGALQPTTDFVVRSTGVQTNANTAWEADIPTEEWVFMADPGVERALFFANHTDDAKIDSYDQQQNVMTKLAFGRQGARPLIEKGILPRSFTWGVMDEITFDGAKPVIYNAYKPLTATVGAAEARAGANLGSTNPVNFTITGQHTITAYFKPVQFTLNVTASPADKGSVTKSPNKATYDFNEAVLLTATPVAGWAFAGWSGDLTGTTNPATVNVTKNMNITATFAQSFTVTTSANPAGGGTVTLTPNKASYAPGEQVQVTATANSGYAFTNWSGALSGTDPTQTVTVNGNLNIVANFSAAQYSFSATSAGNGSVSWTPQKTLYGSGEIVTVTATPSSGFFFVGWTGSLTSTSNPLEVTINGNTSVIAHFAPVVNYTLTVNAVGGGTVTRDPDQAQYPTGTVVTLTAEPDAQKRFSHWSGSVSGTVNPLEVTVTSNMVVTANFVDDVYPLNVTVVGQGTVAASPNQPAGYFIGQQVTLTATPALGWGFVEWSGDASGTSATTTVTIAGATNVTAAFTQLAPVTLTTSITGGGTGTIQISPDKDQYAVGEQVTLTAVPGAGSVFAGWAGDASGSVNPLKLTMDGHKDVVARFIVPSGPFSDNFNTCSLSSVWGTPIDAGGGSTFTSTGMSFKIAVPEGDDHYINRSVNNAPRIMQAADNADLDYIVKFNSDVTQTVQTQGILIEEDATRMMRIDFSSNPNQDDGVPNDEVLVYAGLWTRGTAPDPDRLQQKLSKAIGAADANYLRVTRVAAKWTVFYSATGQADAWQKVGDFANTPLEIKRAGVYAGNLRPAGATVAPAFTADIDFFQNRLVDSSIPEDGPLPSYVTINIIGNGTVATNPPLDQLVCEPIHEAVELTAHPALGWRFLIWTTAGDSETANPVILRINGATSVTATFVQDETNMVVLPMIIR